MRLGVCSTTSKKSLSRRTVYFAVADTSHAKFYEILQCITAGLPSSSVTIIVIYHCAKARPSIMHHEVMVPHARTYSTSGSHA